MQQEKGRTDKILYSIIKQTYKTWFDTQTTPKGCSDTSSRYKTKAPLNRGKRITILYACSKTA